MRIHTNIHQNKSFFMIPSIIHEIAEVFTINSDLSYYKIFDGILHKKHIIVKSMF